MLPTSVLGVICIVFVTINAQDKSFKGCSNHPEGVCYDYTKYSCPKTYKKSYFGCGRLEMCCFPGSTPRPTKAAITSRPSHNNGKLKACRNHPDGYCIDYTRHICPTSFSYSYNGCGYGEKCCYPKPKPTTASKKSCRNHPDGFCVPNNLQGCPSSFLYSYSGCEYNEKCCYPHPKPPSTTLAPHVSHIGDMVGGSGQTCGNPSVNPYVKIVGGQTTTIETYPWQVLIRKRGRHHCGGSLINERWVLTAAHCIVNHSQLDVMVGSTNKKHYSRSQVIPLEGHIVHHEYTGTNNDIALMKLSKPVDLSSKQTRAICLPQAKDNFESQNCIVSGWGAMAEKSYSSDLLRDLSVPIIGTKLCSFYMNVRPKVMCAGHVNGGKDACQGDSGGPLVCKGDNGAWIQAGVVSTGVGCARANKLGLYTDVAAFRDWIDNVVKQNS